MRHGASYRDINAGSLHVALHHECMSGRCDASGLGVRRSWEFVSSHPILLSRVSCVCDGNHSHSSMSHRCFSSWHRPLARMVCLRVRDFIREFKRIPTYAGNNLSPRRATRGKTEIVARRQGRSAAPARKLKMVVAKNKTEVEE